MIPLFFMPRATGRERGRHDRRGGRDSPSQRLSERLRQAHSVRGWVFVHPARIDRRRAAQRGPEQDQAQRVRPRLSEALRLPYFRPTQANSRTNIETGNTGPLRGSQRHSERRAEPQPAWRPTERGGAGRQIRAGQRLSGVGRSGSVRGSPEVLNRCDAVQDFGLYTAQLSTAAS